MVKSIFQHSAVSSGLVTQQELEEAIELVRADAERPEAAPSDERIAARLVELGRLNRWQAQELRKGRTKFTLGPYHCIDSIGRGGMGEVYKAEHSIMGRVVAVKVLPRSKSSPEAIASFAREIRTQAQLDHQNLVRAYDAGHDGNVHFLVTEYVPGLDLRKLVRRQGRLGMSAAAAIIVQAANGLGYAHSRGLIHRDVKPGNLLVTPDGHTKVSDLGLAGYFDESDQVDVHGSKVVGTADYLAPEQITEPNRLSPASDIYSLGCTLYYAVTGKVPFPGGTSREKAHRHCQVLPLDPRRKNPELSDEFVDVIADMMVKSPDERLQTASEVVERLAPWMPGPEAAVRQQAQVAGIGVPVDRSPPRRPILPVLGDTEPNFLVQPADEPGQGESPSQLSVGTQPMASASQDTFPFVLHDRTTRDWHKTIGSVSPLVKVLILIGMIAALGTLAAIVFSLVFAAMA
ncbi:MAG: serine/threonine-protein kinase [Pirellulales bacterium]